MNLRDSSLDCWKPSAISMISQMSARSGTAMETGRKSACGGGGREGRMRSDLGQEGLEPQAGTAVQPRGQAAAAARRPPPPATTPTPTPTRHPP